MELEYFRFFFFLILVNISDLSRLSECGQRRRKDVAAAPANVYTLIAHRLRWVKSPEWPQQKKTTELWWHRSCERKTLQWPHECHAHHMTFDPDGKYWDVECVKNVHDVVLRSNKEFFLVDEIQLKIDYRIIIHMSTMNIKRRRLASQSFIGAVQTPKSISPNHAHAGTARNEVMK